MRCRPGSEENLFASVEYTGPTAGPCVPAFVKSYGPPSEPILCIYILESLACFA
jgi:hypothetical protein